MIEIARSGRAVPNVIPVLSTPVSSAARPLVFPVGRITRVGVAKGSHLRGGSPGSTRHPTDGQTDQVAFAENRARHARYRRRETWIVNEFLSLTHDHEEIGHHHDRAAAVCRGYIEDAQ
jgi:hypothetical protein